MTSRERILSALALKQPDRVPFADDINLETRKRLMGREKFSDLEFADALGLDAIDCRTNDYYAPFFCETQIVNDHEFLGNGLIKSEKDLNLLIFPNPKEEKFYDPVKRFVDTVGKEEKAMFVYMSWCVEGVLNSMGIETFSYALYENPKLVETILDRYAEWNCTVMERLNTVGIDFVITYNNIAYNSGPLVSPQVFREIFLPRLKKVADVCNLPWVYHGDGNIMPLIEDLLTLGMNGLHPIQTGIMDLKTVKEKFGNHLCLWGNVDLTYVLTRGTPEEVEEEVKRCIKDAGSNGGFILGSSNCLPPYCKTENIWAMARAVQKYGNYDNSVIVEKRGD
ncbi:MAG: uroporphyrinogen decarboxylase family protein [Dehalobacterium sp.]